MGNRSSYPNMRVLYWVRRATALILLATLVAVGISGTLLWNAPEGPGSGEATVLGLTKETLLSIHTYAGFIMMDALIIHLYVNMRPLTTYIGISRLRKK